VAGSVCHQRASSRRLVYTLHAGLDVSRKRLDVCLLSEHGELIEEFSAPPDADGLRGPVRHVERHGMAVRAVIESTTGARFVHDRLEQFGWEVLIADAQKVKRWCG
jgi:transposase